MWEVIPHPECVYWLSPLLSEMLIASFLFLYGVPLYCPQAPTPPAPLAPPQMDMENCCCTSVMVVSFIWKRAFKYTRISSKEAVTLQEVMQWVGYLGVKYSNK